MPAVASEPLIALTHILSKMYERYIREYKHHASIYGPNTAIFMLVGSFYELYDIPDEAGDYQTSMKRAIDILGIANVEKRGDAPGGKNGRFGGFGAPQLHKYASMLTHQNWTVVVIDQEKDAKGKVTNRSVSRILSAGTHVEASQSDTFWLAGLWLDAGAWSDERAPPTFGVVALDLTTGAVQTFEGRANGRREAWSSDTLLHFFQVHQPKELVVWWKGDAIDTPSESTFRRILGVPKSQIHCRPNHAAIEKEVVREELLRRCFKPKSVLPLRTALRLTDAKVERALASLLLFVEDHFPAAMEHLHVPAQWNPIDSVYLGNHALTQLNMIGDESVLNLFMRTATPMGKRGMRQRLLYPIADPVRLAKLYEEVDSCFTSSVDLRHIKDISRLHRKITLASLTPLDVLDLDQSYTACKVMLEQLVGAPLAFPDKVEALTAYLSDFTKVFDVEKARTASEDQFCLTTEAGPRTTALEASILATHTELKMKFVQLEDWISNGFSMEFKESLVITGGKAVMKAAAEALRKPIPDFFKGTTLHAKKSSSTLEVPGMNALYMKILRLREDLWKAVKEELPKACDGLTRHIGTWDVLEAWVAQVDISMTIARVSSERGYCRPELLEGDAASIEIVGLRHPLIEAQTSRLEYVTHDVALGAEQGWLVYGMNASGKSSLMKATGIAVLLAQCGAYVPATRMHLTPFRNIFTRILNTDNLWAGLSSFAVEMTELAEALRRADPWSLVLGDEVCSGTESMSAMALVGASLEWLQRKGSRFIFATHLHGLPVPAGIRVWHLRVRYDPATDRLIYDRTLHAGAGSSLYGIEVAKAMGIPIEVLEAAHKIRRGLTGQATEATATASQWNSTIQRRACEVCGDMLSTDLEVHHIRQRKDAVNGHLADGTDMNSGRNLVVVCQTCHDKHHAGEIEIGPLKQTSDGPVRDLTRFVFKPSPETEEDIKRAQAVMRDYPHLPISRIMTDLEQRHGIRMSRQKLQGIRSKL
jgi:DNA mismatch repair protein MutS